MSTLGVKKERVNQQKAGLQEAFFRAVYDSNMMIQITSSTDTRTGTIMALDQFTVLLMEKNLSSPTLIFKSAIDSVSLLGSEDQDSFNTKLNEYMDQYIPNKNNKDKKPSHSIPSTKKRVVKSKPKV